MDIPDNKEIRKEACRIISEYGFGKPIGAFLLIYVIMYAVMMVLFLPMMFLAAAPDEETAMIMMTVMYIVMMLIFYPVTSILMTGYIGFLTKIARGLNAEIGDIFLGFKRRPVTNALIMFGYAVVCLPAVIPHAAAMALMYYEQSIPDEYSLAVGVLMVVLVLATMIITTVISMKYGLVFHISGDEKNDTFGIVELFKTCGKMTYGYKRQIFNMSMFFGLIYFSVVLVAELAMVFPMLLMVENEGAAAVVALMFIPMFMLMFISLMVGMLLYMVYTFMSFTVLYIKINDRYFQRDMIGEAAEIPNLSYHFEEKNDTGER